MQDRIFPRLDSSDGVDEVWDEDLNIRKKTELVIPRHSRLATSEAFDNTCRICHTEQRAYLQSARGRQYMIDIVILYDC